MGSGDDQHAACTCIILERGQHIVSNRVTLPLFMPAAGRSSFWKKLAQGSMAASALMDTV